MRIENALQAAREVLAAFTPGAVAFLSKAAGDPVTEADRQVNDTLRALLVEEDEGWLSEETADDLVRLERRRVWVVDPLDGTKEFVAGVPEWCVSIGLIEDGEAVAGGICNPVTRETFLGSRETGMTWNGAPACTTRRCELAGALVLASRSECARGDWERFREAAFTVQPMGSVAYKLARVAAGLADATWTLIPKNEWDVVAGVALVEAAGGRVTVWRGGRPTFNHPKTLLPGLIATAPGLADEVERLVAP
jgi:myo-inositol-1(or 4)-monophosphatase